ncbi:MAG: Holliday junction resolvase RuvX [Actinobacteria bacterium]|jgi:putative holliday junction resolvase|nr:Holliday junction resolvase RuvX [Actinomycetota bacterium]
MNEPIPIGQRIGFDYGVKRIGVATSDAHSILVSPHATLVNDDKLMDKLTEIITDINPIYIVIGDPKNLSGKDGEKSVLASEFGILIKKLFAGPVYLVDERLTTTNAYAQMREIGKSEKESKHVIDQIAAINILESAILNEKSGTSVGRIL